MTHPLVDAEAAVRQTLEDVFPDRKVVDVRAGGISWNELNHTVRVEFAYGDPVYLKLALDRDGQKIGRERGVVEYVGARCRIGVPDVLAHSRESDPPYLVTASMPGTNAADGWSDRQMDEQADLLRRIGFALAEVHSCAFDRHGQIAGGDIDELRLETGSWTEILIDRIEWFHDRGPAGQFDHLVREGKETLQDHRDLLDGTPSVLLHGDPALPNIFQDDECLGFIDWELAHVGDPARELNRAEKQTVMDGPDHLLEALHEGYKARAGSFPDGFHQRAPIYDMIWHLGGLAVFDRRVEASDQSTEEFAESFESTMDSHLERIRGHS